MWEWLSEWNLPERPERRMLKLGDAMHARMIKRLHEDARRKPDLRDLADP